MSGPATAQPEKIELFDGEEWRCLCGNVADSSGFYPCDDKGGEVEPDAAHWGGELYVCGGCGRVINQFSCQVVGLKAGRYRSTTQPNLFFWAQEEPPSRTGGIVCWIVTQQVDRFPATEAFDDWFTDFKDADEIAQKLARGEDV